MFKAWLVKCFLFIGLIIADTFGTTSKPLRKNFYKARQFLQDEQTHSWKVQSITTEPTEELDQTQENFTKNKDCSLKGTWINSHGSEIILSVTNEGHLIGRYRTAVEAAKGAAGYGYAEVTGHASAGGKHRTFGFTVNWNGGTSTTSWTGQCFVCEGQEVLQTTWILTTEMDTCNDNWLANRIGQDRFTRRP